LIDVAVRLEGGLGNQMFQYATAKALAIRNGADLVLDLSWFATSSERYYALTPFNITAREIGSGSKNKRISLRFLRKVVRRLTKRTDTQWNGCPVFREKYFHFDQEVITLKAPVCLAGYFQSDKYFADCRDAIASEFTLAAPPKKTSQVVLEKIMGSNAICLHIRRGDYVTSATTNAFHGTCSLEYYYEGLRFVCEGLSSPHCFVFSDDPGWAWANLRTELPTTIVDIHGTDEAHEDLRLMAACKHFVIANSSLSWWGAWLGNDSKKRVVAPKRWFLNTANDTKDLIPERWVRL
jgi:hypothetical protein